jgi:hypothetical protein
LKTGETFIARFPYFVYHTSMLRRFGVFLFIIGFFFLYIFFSAGVKDANALVYLYLGAPITALGIIIWRRFRKRSEMNRFRLLRKLFSRDKEA